MLKTLILLFFEFFKTGLFTFGGGYASLPFLYQISEKYNWFTGSELTQLIAISGLTPGPIGLNMATFSGFMTLGIFGALISSVALILPIAIVASQVFRLYQRFFENKYVKSILYILKPTSCAMISAVAIRLFYELIFKSGFDIYGLILLLILFIITFFLKRNPLTYILMAAIFGIIHEICKMLL